MNMNPFLIAALAVGSVLMLLVALVGWQLLGQNGRVLLRLEEIEKRLDELQFGEEDESGVDPTLVTSAATTNVDEEAPEERFGKRSLVRSKIKRDGLKAGTPAPDFRLPRLDGRGDLALCELRGRRVLLVFSDPHCGPCNALAPELENFHREHPEMEVVMISKGEPKDNRAKAKEHGITFPIVLQQQWEISRR